LQAIPTWLHAVIEKAYSGDELEPVESRQFSHYIKEYLTQSFWMLRLYDQGLITEDEVRAAFRAIREYASIERFRQEIETQGLTGLNRASASSSDVQNVGI
jgi:hypothetical protein